MILRLRCGAKCLQDAHRVPAEMPKPSPSKRSFTMEALLPLEKETTELPRAGGSMVFCVQNIGSVRLIREGCSSCLGYGGQPFFVLQICLDP